jgi:16S rRNA (guanine527-N7)-methyltransferase
VSVEAGMMRVENEGPGVSRETLGRLRDFADLVARFNPHLNLVSPGDLPGIWERHILDSLQLLDLAPAGWRRWADLGSGGGFPGLVIAIAARELHGTPEVVLVESDRRKAVFLQEAAARFAPDARVVDQRIEATPPLSADVVSARALAPLATLLGLVGRHLAHGGVALLPKGQNAAAEVEVAQALWRFSVERIPRESSDGAPVLRVRDIEGA